MKRLLLSCLLTLVVTASSVIPIRALTPTNQMVLDGGYVAKQIGTTWDKKPIYQADFGAPEYLPDLTTKIDTTWKSVDGQFISGANLLEASVIGDMVTVYDKNKAAYIWTPMVTVDNLDKTKDKSGVESGIVTVKAKAKILGKDPINSHYDNNTVEWDYGSGIVRRLRLIEGVIQETYVIQNPIAGDFSISNYVTKVDTFAGKIKAPVAYDADYQPIDLSISGNTTKLAKDKALDSKLKYPITIDPDTTFTTSASDGYLEYPATSGGGTVWATVQGAASATSVTDTTVTNYTSVFAGLSGVYYWAIDRSALYFDTSGLNESVNITATIIKIYPTNVKTQIGAWHLQVQSGQPTYPSDPLVAGDYDKTHYSGNGGNLASGSMVVGSYNTVSLNATGMAWINTTGTTKLVLRETEHDVNNSSPGNLSNLYNSITYYSYEQGDGYRPQLIVTFIPGTLGILTAPASNIAKTSARLNSSITDDGGDNVTAWYAWDTANIAGNLITNGNFESGDPPSNWTSGGDNTTLDQSSIYKIGQKSLSLNHAGATYSLAYQNSGITGLADNTTISFGVWVLNPATNPAGLGVYAIIYDGAANHNTSSVPNDGLWHWVSANATLVDAGTSIIELVVSSAVGTAYFDNAIATVGSWTSQQPNQFTGNTPYADIVGLTGSTLYYFTVIGENTKSAVLGGTANFTTENSVGNIQSFYGNPSSTSISLGWTFGVGDSQALIIYRPDRFPTTIADGTQVYLGSLTYTEHTGLTAGKTYYYMILGESGGVYSSGNSTLALTTTVSLSASEDLDTPPVIPEFNQAPDSSGLANLGGIYQLTNGFFTAWGIPVNNGYSSMYLLAVTGFGFIIWAKTSKLFPAIVITTLLMLAGVILNISPAYPLLIMAAVLAAAWALNERQTI